MTREQAESDIRSLYDTDTKTGRELLLELVDQLGLAALTDDAVIRLAEMHRSESGLGRWT